jgi:thiol-disulfide isomerase/thioredoxin
MKPKTLVTAVLLAFVIASIAYAVVTGLAAKTDTANSNPGESAGLSEVGGSTPEDAAGKGTDAPSHKVIVYYFHGTARCPTCMKFEAFTQEIMKDSFADATENGRLELRIVNVDEPENKHFLQDYQLYTKSVVLSDTRGGEQKRWKNLEKIWELHPDKDAFFEYVRNEVDSYLAED